MAGEVRDVAGSKATVAGAGAGVSPCAGCRLLRRRCSPDCVFAPYFPADEPHKFANVHKVFGASNVNKLLQEVAVAQRSDAASSLVYEANARLRDPVYGCAGAVSNLQRQIDILSAQLALARAETLRLRLRLHHAAHLAGSSAAVQLSAGSASSSAAAATASDADGKQSFSPAMFMEPHSIGQPMWSC
ncbi:LOB domain-containing protein 4 [Apostasia shenzhenica]|uniref:LOB domain-containing protein 4 n=1 Tax=Apostasia shenzhenica TaxID=1088818 RepID=A0A2I0AN97_9ASPA|nr:LOB domain-containing protein 4 [Apostasia shenzhenica]